MNEIELAQQIEGLLFAVGKPLSRAELQKVLRVSSDDIAGALAKLSTDDRGLVVVDDGKTIELRVSPLAAEHVERLRRDEYSRDIGRPGLEVIAAIAYRGPLTRAEIDFIRGVNSSAMLRRLTTRGLIRRTSNPKDERSFLYELTTELLAQLGATHVRDLPDYDVVREKLHQLEAAYRGAEDTVDA